MLATVSDHFDISDLNAQCNNVATQSPDLIESTLQHTHTHKPLLESRYVQESLYRQLSVHNKHLQCELVALRFQPFGGSSEMREMEVGPRQQ